MKTKNEYLKKQGINLEKDLDVGTYTKIRFAMEEYAKDYHESEVKKFRLGVVVGQSELLRDYFTWHKEKGYVSHKPSDIDEFINEQ